MGVDFVRLLDLGPDFPQILRNSILDNLDNNFCKILSAFKVDLLESRKMLITGSENLARNVKAAVG